MFWKFVLTEAFSESSQFYLNWRIPNLKEISNKSFWSRNDNIKLASKNKIIAMGTCY